MKEPLWRSSHSFTKALSFLDHNPEWLTPTMEVLHRDLRAAKKKADLLWIRQISEENLVGKDGTILRQLKDELREKHLLKLRRIALVVLRGVPGISDSFRVPHKKASVEDLEKATARIAKNCKIHKKAFLKAKQHPDFIVRMQRAAKAMAKKAADPDTVISRRAVVTRAIPEPIRRGRDIVNAITGEMVATYGRESQQVHLWNLSARVGKRIGRPLKRRKPPVPLPGTEQSAEGSGPS